MQVKKQQLELDMGKQTDSRSEEYIQGCMLSPCLFNLHAEYIMQNAGLDQAQARIKMTEPLNQTDHASPVQRSASSGTFFSLLPPHGLAYCTLNV